MQYINLNKTLQLDAKILDLLLISIDDHVDTIDNNEGVRISGKISIGGSAKTLEGNKEFSDNIDLDIFLTYEEIVERNTLNISVNDFNYKIEDNKLYLDISLKIDGLKEIETTFLTEEDNQIITEEEIDDEEKKVYIDEEIIVGDARSEEIIDKIERSEKEDIVNEIERDERLINEEPVEEIILENKLIEEVNEECYGKEIVVEKEEIVKKSLIKSVFSNKRIKEEISWRLHCVKNETSYEQIANKYGINLNKLISINKNEKLSEGKLIFLPLD